VVNKFMTIKPLNADGTRGNVYDLYVDAFGIRILANIFKGLN